MSERITCPDCRGMGHGAAFADGESGGRFVPDMRCIRCKGARTISREEGMWIVRGRVCATRRRQSGESLMQMAQRIGVPAAELSAMEHGRINPAPLEGATSLEMHR